jgi:hypothetical protein
VPISIFPPDNKNPLISLLSRSQKDSTRSENILTRSLNESTRSGSIRTLSRLTGLPSYQFVLTSACAVHYIALSSPMTAVEFESQ